MSRLRIFTENDPSHPRLTTSDHAEMAKELGKIGVAFEQWQASAPVAPGDAPEKIMDAYRADIDRLVAQHGFKTVDVVSIAPDNPQREAMRTKFLDEHFHKEDEVRFFVAGSGLFTLHVNDEVYEVKSGDSLSKIAKRVYGNASDWKRIFEANRDTIKDPDKIFPGQKLKIPSA